MSGWTPTVAQRRTARQDAVMDTAFLSETVRFPGHNGDELEAYAARPTDNGKRGGVVVIHHLPGYDRETKEFVRRFADRGYDAVAANLYSRGPGDHHDQAAAVRAAGGVADEQVMGDVKGAVDWLRGLATNNGKVAVIGHCSGGRHTYLTAATHPIDAAIVCYGGLITGETPPQMSSMVTTIDRTAQTRSPVPRRVGNAPP